jgi:carbamoyl-phosphate synthase large subunit
MSASKWRGPCEVEVMKARGGRYYLMEINPRFPAWTFLSAGAGMNLPEAVARLAMGESIAPMRDFKAGTMFVRIAIDQIATLEDLQTITTAGERIRAEESSR